MLNTIFNLVVIGAFAISYYVIDIEFSVRSFKWTKPSACWWPPSKERRD